MPDSTKEEISEKVRCALALLLQRDKFLLEHDVNERSITHKLAEYLQEQFPEWDVDCEYNRIGNHRIEAKRLQLEVDKTYTDDDQGKTVYPDVIVHRRGETQENLLVIEIKKSTNPETKDRDEQKLRAFKSQLGYRYGIFLKLQTAVEHLEIPQIDFV